MNVYSKQLAVLFYSSVYGQVWSLSSPKCTSLMTVRLNK